MFSWGNTMAKSKAPSRYCARWGQVATAPFLALYSQGNNMPSLRSRSDDRLVGFRDVLTDVFSKLHAGGRQVG
jgi:hypothetical protein